MFYRLMMITNGVTALAGASFWAPAFMQKAAAASDADLAIGYILLTMVRGY